MVHRPDHIQRVEEAPNAEQLQASVGEAREARSAADLALEAHAPATERAQVIAGTFGAATEVACQCVLEDAGEKPQETAEVADQWSARVSQWLERADQQAAQ